MPASPCAENGISGPGKDKSAKMKINDSWKKGTEQRRNEAHGAFILPNPARGDFFLVLKSVHLFSAIGLENDLMPLFIVYLLDTAEFRSCASRPMSCLPYAAARDKMCRGRQVYRRNDGTVNSNGGIKVDGDQTDHHHQGPN